MSEFDKHWDGWAIASNCTEDEAKIHFEAGQQSQQAKIDEWQAMVDETIPFGLYHIKDRLILGHIYEGV